MRSRGCIAHGKPKGAADRQVAAAFEVVVMLHAWFAAGLAQHKHSTLTHALTTWRCAGLAVGIPAAAASSSVAATAGQARAAPSAPAAAPQLPPPALDSCAAEASTGYQALRNPLVNRQAVIHPLTCTALEHNSAHVALNSDSQICKCPRASLKRLACTNDTLVVTAHKPAWCCDHRSTSQF